MADPGRVRWHLEQAKEHAQQAIDGRDRLGESWVDDPVTKAGMSHLVEVVAEYMGNVPLEIQDQFPHVPWKAMGDMRNRVAHTYHDIDPEIVDSTIEVDLPQLIVEIDNMLGVIH